MKFRSFLILNFFSPAVALAEAGFLLLFPLSVLAAPQNFKDLVNDYLLAVINGAIPAVLALAFFVFIWGLFQSLFFPEKEGNIEKGRNIMVWGVLAFFVMLSVWGIVKALQLTFGF